MAAGVPGRQLRLPLGPARDRRPRGQRPAGRAAGRPAGMATALLALWPPTTTCATRLGAGRPAHRPRAGTPHALAERWVGIFADAGRAAADRGRLESRAMSPLPRAPARPHRRGRRRHRHHPGRGPRTRRSAWAVEAARAATDTWLVVPAHEHPAPTVSCRCRGTVRRARGARRDRRARPTSALRDPAEDGWPERRGPVAELAADLRRGRTSVVCLEPWPRDRRRGPGLLSTGCTVEIEFWETDVDGDLVAPRRNPYADRIPSAAWPRPSTPRSTASPSAPCR